MKTYILTLDDEQEELIKALAKALKIEVHLLSEQDEVQALLIAMEEGKPYGRLSEGESKSFMDSLGK